MDTKKKELIGEFKNNGTEYRPSGNPRLVNDHDFMGPDGKASPYGVYDTGANEGFVSVGISSDTAEFAVNSIRSWLELMGFQRYPDMNRLMITADCGGSNGRRNRLWKVKLQELADEKNISIFVRHYPPGTSKWNKIEHRMFSHISINWRGQPLSSLETIVNLISNTRTESGLRILCHTDLKEYRKGIKITDKELEELNLIPDEWRGDWNYSISPRR